MVNKRSNRQKVQKFFCPYCERRLWRSNRQKYRLFYKEVAELRERLNFSHKKASLLAAQIDTFVDRNSWIEDFYCEEHGQIWLRVSKQTNEKLVGVLAQREDWKCTTGTIDPNSHNPSISQYSYYMSRGCSVNNLKRSAKPSHA
jgi:competence CoiA-like predicted nuclease